MATSGDAIVARHAGGEAPDAHTQLINNWLLGKLFLCAFQIGSVMAARDGNPESLEKVLKYSEKKKKKRFWGLR